MCIKDIFPEIITVEFRSVIHTDLPISGVCFVALYSHTKRCPLTIQFIGILVSHFNPIASHKVETVDMFFDILFPAKLKH